ncbi:hypothetical protein [Bacillus sp. JCM 19041]|uniref:hypothetical protein n=1 Tax=Bacillus sp. JCM 19041 TaxID=1460637 RepID=UPI00336A701F
MLLRLGENTKIVSERLGHGSTEMTADVYSHVTPDIQENTAQKIEKASLFERCGQNVVMQVVSNTKTSLHQG